MNYHYSPFSAIVGQDTMKLALLLNVVNPAIGGVLIQGEKGTAKTTSVRGLSGIMSEGTRVVELPVGSSEDRVVGTINIRKVMRDGEKQFEPGILKEADGNILYVDEINLLDDHIVDVILDSAATGINRIERDGISFSHQAKFVLVGTMNHEEGTLRPQLLDRFGLCVSIESSLSPKERAEVTKRRLKYECDPEAFRLNYAKEENHLSAQLLKARTLYSQIIMNDEIIEFCSGICAKMSVDGYRADITMMKTAGAIAALDHRTEVTQDDF